MDLQMAMQKLREKVLVGDAKTQDKIPKVQALINRKIEKKQLRLESPELMEQLSPREPEILGSTYVVPLTQIECNSHYGMSRDDEAEALAMKVAMDYENY